MDPFSAHNAFALSLYNSFALENDGKNFLLSPVSIFATLSMILPGARDATLHQMLDAMQLNSSAPLDEVEAAIGKMLAAAVSMGDSGQLLMANKAYIESGYKVHQEYLTALHKYFSAEIGRADFSSNADAGRKSINDWVATVTKGKIDDLLTPGSISYLTRLVLVNALYFKAKWLVPFDPRLTRVAEFETRPGSAPVSVQMMHRTGNWPIVYIPEVLTGVRLDFEAGGGRQLSMFAILPAERHGLDALLSRMTRDDWLGLVNAPVESSRAVVALPKVRLAGRAELSGTNYLPRLGLGNLFSDTADLSGIASAPGDLHVSSFAHQAVLEWDELGAEGAAATAAVVNTRSAPPMFKFDQPFLVIVAMETAGPAKRLPVFLGRVSNPGQGI